MSQHSGQQYAEWTQAYFTKYKRDLPLVLRISSLDHEQIVLLFCAVRNIWLNRGLLPGSQRIVNNNTLITKARLLALNTKFMTTLRQQFYYDYTLDSYSKEEWLELAKIVSNNLSYLSRKRTKEDMEIGENVSDEEEYENNKRVKRELSEKMDILMEAIDKATKAIEESTKIQSTLIDGVSFLNDELTKQKRELYKVGHDIAILKAKQSI